jgi:hypothetical protein
MEELSKLVELVKQEAPQARVKVDSLMVTHYFTMEELLDICNKYAEYKCALTNVSGQSEQLCECPAHTFYEWEKSENKCTDCGKKILSTIA